MHNETIWFHLNGTSSSSSSSSTTTSSKHQQKAAAALLCAPAKAALVKDSSKVDTQLLLIARCRHLKHPGGRVQIIWD